MGKAIVKNSTMYINQLGGVGNNGPAEEEDDNSVEYEFE